MKGLFLGYILISIFLSAFSQNDSLYYNKELAINALAIEVKSQSFFDNLEFYNNIQKGYTLTGFNVEPRIAYAVNPNSKISAGFHTLSFFGEESLTRIVPVLTIQVLLSPGIEFKIGNIDATNRHCLPEPLYKSERELTHQPEGGLQFLFNTNHFVGDTWLNWEKFLFHGDTIQEEFTVGFSGKIFLSGKSSVAIEIPIYALAVHRGGQINASNDPVSTLANFGGGINLTYKVAPKARLGAEGLVLLGRDLSPSPHHTYKNGWATYPRVFFQTNLWFADIGYWRASEMILPRGEQIFGSLSTVSSQLNTPERELVVGSLSFGKHVARGFRLAFGGHLYYDVRNPLLDYRFSIVAAFDEKFLLRKLK